VYFFNAVPLSPSVPWENGRIQKTTMTLLAVLFTEILGISSKLQDFWSTKRFLIDTYIVL